MSAAAGESSAVHFFDRIVVQLILTDGKRSRLLQNKDSNASSCGGRSAKSAIESLHTKFRSGLTTVVDLIYSEQVLYPRSPSGIASNSNEGQTKTGLIIKTCQPTRFESSEIVEIRPFRPGKLELNPFS